MTTVRGERTVVRGGARGLGGGWSAAAMMVAAGMAASAASAGSGDPAAQDARASRVPHIAQVAQIAQVPQAAQAAQASQPAQGTPAAQATSPTPVLLQLDAQARSAVPNDEMVVLLAAERAGPQPGPLNEAVIAQLNATIAEARAVEGVRARLGNVSTQPEFNREGRPMGWRVRGEVVLESQQVQKLAQLGGRLSERMQLASVQFRLSTERRQAEEKRLVGDAARAFRARAADAAAAFGFDGYALRELSLRAGNAPPGPRPMMSSRGVAEAAAMPLPTEGGDSDVVVAVTGTVELGPRR